jgi:hypothetical protein
LLRITEDQLQFTPDMKKLFTLTMLISFTMICSCQKQDSAAERQFAQRKTELDAREQTLDQREKELALRETVLNERERALAEKGKAIANGSTIPIPPNLQSRPISPDLQSRDQLRDPAVLKAERERVKQQLPPQFKALLNPPDRSQGQAQGLPNEHQQLLDQRQRRLEELQRTKAQMQNKGAIPATTAAPAAVYPGAEATSPSPSPTPQ